MKRMILSLALLLILTAAITGCSDDPTTPTNSDTTETPSPTTEAPTDTPSVTETPEVTPTEVPTSPTEVPTSTPDPSATEAPSATPTKEPTSTPEPTATPTTPAPSSGKAKITVKGNQFMVDGKSIFMNGVNTPWDNWNDCGGSFDEAFWDNHFAELKEAGVNCTRIWISCNGDVGFSFSETGVISSVSAKFWRNMDTLMALAEKHQIYIMATLMSFDHFKNTNQTYTHWRTLVAQQKGIDSYINEYVIPLCERYDDNDYLWSIDLCNEPDWVHENAECGKLSWAVLGNFFAQTAAAIHENSDILVTIGFGMVKYNSERYNGDMGSDAYLQSCYNDKDAYLDFYSTHYYEWEAPWFGFPFDKSPSAFYLDDSKPCLIGEFPATGMTSNTSGSKKMSGSECYLGCYNNGWQGIMAWTSNGVDSCGKLSDFLDGVKAIAELMK